MMPALAQSSKKPDPKATTTKAQAVPAGQKEQPTQVDVQQIQKVFEIKHADVDRLAGVLSLFGGVNANRELRVIGVSASSRIMPAIEETIRRLDVPPPTPKNIELTAYLLMGDEQEGSSSATPADLEGVIKQLRATFAYKSFNILDTLVVRSRDKKDGEVRGVARFSPDESTPAHYKFTYASASIVSDEKGRSIRVDRLRLNASVPVKPKGSSVFQVVDTGFATDVDIREGQKVVVGKATVDGTTNALILVITAKIVD
jgi:hypothetical protein